MLLKVSLSLGAERDGVSMLVRHMLLPSSNVLLL